MNIYQQEILDKYKNPKFQGLSDDYTNTSRSSNLSCGDDIEVYIKVNNRIIENIRYTGEGCIIALSSAEILAENLVGKTVEDVTTMTMESALEYIGIPLTTSRIKCAMLSFSAIQKALQ